MISYDRIRDFVRRETAEIRNEYSAVLPPGFQNSRKLFRSFRIDPTKHRPSSEALWRRVKKGEPLPEINPFVDLTNLISLKFQIPYGLYDIAKLYGDITLVIGENGSAYEGIRKERVSLQGKIVLYDRSGAFGNPSSDSLRASTDANSRSILQVIFFDPVQEKSEVILKSSADLYRRYIKITDIRSYFA